MHLPNAFIRRITNLFEPGGATWLEQLPALLAEAAARRFRSVQDWAHNLAGLRFHYGGTTGPFPAALVGHVEGLSAELVASQAAPVVLQNILGSTTSASSPAGLC